MSITRFRVPQFRTGSKVSHKQNKHARLNTDLKKSFEEKRNTYSPETTKKKLAKLVNEGPLWELTVDIVRLEWKTLDRRLTYTQDLLHAL